MRLPSSMHATTACALLIVACRSAPTSPLPAREPVADDAAPPAAVSLSAPGLTLSEVTWTGADDATGPAWVVRLDDPTLTVLPSDTLRRLPDFEAPDGQTWVHVNGGFYDTARRAMSLVVHDGTEHHALGSGSGVLTGPHPVRIVHRDAWAVGPTEALQSIDRIVNDGTSLVTVRPEARRATRSLVAVADGAVMVVVMADARSVTRADGSATLHATSFLGPTLAEAAAFAVDPLGADAALNLDGAVSSALIVQTPDGRFEVVGEQPVINAVRLTPTAP